MTAHLLLLAFGVALLWGGIELTVRNAVRLAGWWGLSHVVVGMTIVAFGTDLPELVVAVDGALNILRGTDSSGIIVGNAVGSCLCQISLVVGLVAVCRYLPIGRRQVRRMLVALAVSWLLLLLVGIDGRVSRTEGGILVVCFGVYAVAMFDPRLAGVGEREPQRGVAARAVALAVLLLVAGLALVAVGADFLLEHSLALAEAWGVRQSFVGVILVALGTSLPELGISLNAALKGKPELSLGNIVGSNVFDLLVPAGVAGLIATLRFDPRVCWLDLPALLVLSALFLWFLRRRAGLQRAEGFCLVIAYLAFVALRVAVEGF